MTNLIRLKLWLFGVWSSLDGVAEKSWIVTQFLLIFRDSRTSYENSNSWHDRRGRNRGPERDQARGRRQDRGWRGQKHPDDEPRRDDEDSESQWSRRFPDTDSRFNDSQDLFPDPEKSTSLPPLNSALPLLPPPISASLAPPVEEAEQKFEEERSIDLDTRLQMLMKGKTANMPAFLLGSESSEAEQESFPPPRPGPLSRTPSPFLTRQTYIFYLFWFSSLMIFYQSFSSFLDILRISIRI